MNELIRNNLNLVIFHLTEDMPINLLKMDKSFSPNRETN